MFKNSYRDQDKAFIKSSRNYDEIYTKSIDKSDQFWSEVAKRISWFKSWDKVSSVDFNSADIKWFEGGKLNACYNCIDRHIESGH